MNIDGIFGKIEIIKRCLRRIDESIGPDPSQLDANFDNQDIFVLNLQRAAQAAIDLAHILISTRNWELPATYKDSFTILLQHGVITKTLCVSLQNMVGFRNIAIHDYQELSLDIMKSILVHHLKDFEDYYQTVYTTVKNWHED